MYQKEDVEEIKKVLGENLVMLAEYNNGDETRCIAICNILDLKTLDDLKKVDIIPMVFTKDEIKNAIDVFPVEFLNIKKRMNELMSRHTGQPIEVIEKATDRDNFLSAREALEYGLVDHVLERMPPMPARPDRVT